MRFITLLLGLILSSALAVAREDTLRIRSMQLTDGVQSCNLYGFRVKVDVAWRPDIEDAPDLQLELILKQASGAPMVYRQPDCLEPFLRQFITLHHAPYNQKEVEFFVPYSQLKIPQGATGLLPSFRIIFNPPFSVEERDSEGDTTAADTIKWVLLGPPAKTLQIMQPAVYPMFFKLEHLEIRDQDAFGRHWDMVGSDPDIEVKLSCAAVNAVVDWHSYERRKNTATVSYADELAKIYLTANDRLDVVIYDDDFNGPETVACASYSLAQLQKGTLTLDNMGLIISMKATVAAATGR